MHITRSRARTALIAVASIAFLIKILLAIKTYGTNDVYTYDEFSTWSRYLGVAMYYHDPYFNHPPSMISALHFLSWLARSTPVPFSFWIRLPGILADAGTLCIVWKLLGERVQEWAILLPLLLLAAAPPLILISGFHGNTDSIVIFLLIASIYFVQTGKSAWAAGAALGLAHCVKVFPVIAGPAILLNLSGLSRKLKFCAAAAMVILVAWSPYLFQDPRAVIAKVFGYRSLYGEWGLSNVLLHVTAIAPWLAPLDEVFQRFGTYIALALVLLVTWRMNQGSAKPTLFSQIGLVFFLFLSVSNGFGVQYLAWLAPWVVELGWVPAAVFYGASGVFLFLVYNFWAQGFPWYLADSTQAGGFGGYVDHAQRVCWFSLLLVLWLDWKRIAGISGWKRLLPFAPFPAGWRWAAGLTAATALYAIVPAQLPGPPFDPNKYEPAVREINANSYLDLSALLKDLGRYQDSIQAAKEALDQDPVTAAGAAEIISADEAALAKR